MLTLVIFQVLMSRGDGFKENEAGVSSVLFYHAAIITHGECYLLILRQFKQYPLTK